MLGPPMTGFSRPLAARAESRISSAGRRKRDLPCKQRVVRISRRQIGTYSTADCR